MAAQVGPDSHLTLHYRVSLAPGGNDATSTAETEVISTFGGRPATLQMGQGQLAEPLETLLIGLPEGCEQRFDLAAGQGYGQRNADLIQAFDRAAFDANTSEGPFEPGDLVDFNGQGGERVAGVLKEINEQRVLVDFNHPLAGQAITFEVHLLGVL